MALLTLPATLVVFAVELWLVWLGLRVLRPVDPRAGVLLAAGAGIGGLLGMVAPLFELGIAAYIFWGGAFHTGNPGGSWVFLGFFATAALGPLGQATAVGGLCASLVLLALRIRGTDLDERWLDHADGAEGR